MGVHITLHAQPNVADAGAFGLAAVMMTGAPFAFAEIRTCGSNGGIILHAFAPDVDLPGKPDHKRLSFRRDHRAVDGGIIGIVLRIVYSPNGQRHEGVGLR